eukprot:m.499284 g.499284  ORF g.499284 m.499284 type:complete len:519 (+) comp57068_c0_seq1:201-1757(+)
MSFFNLRFRRKQHRLFVNSDEQENANGTRRSSQGKIKGLIGADDRVRSNSGNAGGPGKLLRQRASMDLSAALEVPAATLGKGKKRRRQQSDAEIVPMQPSMITVTQDCKEVIAYLDDKYREQVALSIDREGTTVTEREFRQIQRIGLNSDTTMATRPENVLKNRYPDILPYDHSRVRLKHAKGSDENALYINANHIPHVVTDPTDNRSKGFVATQGPLKSTVNTFWRMVWELESQVIVMVTSEREQGKVKCSRYWPDRSSGEGSQEYGGGVQVEHVQTEATKLYMRRTFRLKRKKASRLVYHLQFSQWRDKRAPEFEQLMRFHEVVQATHRKLPSTTGPKIVHCSAGVGRTGTYIAVELLMASLSLKLPIVSVKDTVSMLRHQRCSMVQSLGQYDFLCKFLLEAVILKKKEAENELAEAMRQLTGDDARPPPPRPKKPAAVRPTNTSSPNPPANSGPVTRSGQAPRSKRAATSSNLAAICEEQEESEADDTQLRPATQQQRRVCAQPQRKRARKQQIV